jgi:3alpha(or 20beta)-hydroxysteroid dehydrogenase
MSKFDLAGRKALVTGGARGLGAGMAAALSEAGAAVMIGDVLTDVGRETAKSIATGGAKAAFVSLDVTDEASWQAAVSATIAQLGGFDILVNNAGVEITSLVINVEAQDLRRMWDVNVVGAALGMKHAFRAMKPDGAAGKGGAVVNVASVAATIAFPGIAGYSATKSGVDRLTRVGAMESGKLGYGVRVNCIYPGLVATDMGVQLGRRDGGRRALPKRGSRNRRRHRADPSRPARRGRGHGGRRRVPRFGCGPVHHRRRASGRWGHGNVGASPAAGRRKNNRRNRNHDRQEARHRLWRVRLHGSARLRISA